MNSCIGFITELSTYASNGGVEKTTLTNRRPSLHPFFLHFDAYALHRDAFIS